MKAIGVEWKDPLRAEEGKPATPYAQKWSRLTVNMLMTPSR